MKMKKDDAVSPIVGVMLLIVITVVIAGVVAMVASGYTSSVEKSPVGVINYLGSVQGNNFDEGYCGEIGLLFEYPGGESFKLSEITFTLSSEAHTLSDEVTFSLWDAPEMDNHMEPGKAKLLATSLDYRFKKIGVTVSNGKKEANQMIVPGDRFIVYVDTIEQVPGGRYNKAIVDVKRDGDTYSYGEFELGSGTKYTFKDTKTGNVIASGNLIGKTYQTI